MAQNKVRSGISVNLNTGAYIVTAGTTGASARVVSSVQGAYRSFNNPVMIQNLDATNSVYVRLNTDDASATVADFVLLGNEGLLVDWVNVNSLSFYMGAGVYTTILCHGWQNS